MRRAILTAFLVASTLCFACNRDKGTASTATPDPDAREDCAVSVADRQLLWGDLHVHTAHSFDAWVYDVRLEPDDAYRFARGEAVDVQLDPSTPETTSLTLAEPLDFAAVTDHAEFLGEVSACIDSDSQVYDEDFCVNYREADQVSIQYLGTALTPEEPSRIEDLCGDGAEDCLARAGDVWSRIQEAAEDHYDRTETCAFTTFVAYEWTGATNISNLHRNVLFRGAVVPTLPISYFEAPTAQDLWAQLSTDCLQPEQGCDVLAIPHNSNLSNGNLFYAEYPTVLDGSQTEAEAAQTRADMEPLVEIYQHKGSSECRNGLSGILGEPDELCDFEQYRIDDPSDCGDEPGLGAMAGFGCVHRLDTVQGALLEGLKEQARIGVNPYEMGIIAGTDTHSATPGNVDESRYVGHLGSLEGTAQGRLEYPGLNPGGVVNSPGGLSAVWATENNRAEIFAALRRREVYGTSGPRIGLRVFVGSELSAEMCGQADLVEQADAVAVPMGGRVDGISGAPKVLAWAWQDPATGSTPLERLQVIKGWIDADGEANIEVYDVAGGDKVGAVDTDTCEASGEGYESLCTVWEDPDFDPDQNAFWYVRAVENPTCRWSAHDCVGADKDSAAKSCFDDAIAQTLRERAWSSPVWYTP